MSAFREQARIQIEGRERGEPVYEVLALVPGFGLACMPEPCPGDIFLDLEGDPFVGEGGLEYLFGYVTLGENDALNYTGQWALSREDERRIFEGFIDFVIARWQQYPDLHIYHFAPYEPVAFKAVDGPLRLARGRDRPHAAREAVRRSLRGSQARHTGQR